MSTPAVAAPPAPAPKPAASAAPPSDGIPPQPIEKPIDFDKDIDDDLAAIDEDETGKRPAQRQQKPEVKPEVKPPAKPAAKPQSKPEDQEPEPDDKKDEPGDEDPDKELGDSQKAKDGKTDEPVKPIKAADLRTAYEGLKKKVKEEFEPKVAKLEARIKELETSGPEATKPILEELEAKKKRLDELESRIKFTDYKESTEFKEKYEKPYLEAWKKAVADLSELTVQTEDGGTRVATTQDLLHLANLPLGEARSQARALFGDAADDVMAHRRAIRELSAAQTKALEDAKNNASEHEKKLASQRQIESQQIAKAWDETNKALAEKYPKWFAETEGDTEGNELLRKGFSVADLHFLGAKGLTPAQIELLPPKLRDEIKANGDLSIQGRIHLDALLRNKIASHSRLALNLKKATARIQELEKSLAEYEGSEPPATRGSGKPAKPALDPMQEAEAELEAINRQNA